MKLYNVLAEWWPLLSPPEDYEEEAGLYRKALGTTGGSLLELGSGGGNNAFWLKPHFDTVVLTDVSEPMLAISRKLNPEAEHIAADMRTLRLGRTFDVVFAHDAICYMSSEADLLAALQTAFVHLRPGGVALFCPDQTLETFPSGGSTDCGGSDAPDGRAMRFLEWCWDPDPSDNQYFADYTCVLRGVDGAVEVVHDRHVEGIFHKQQWFDLLTATGFIEVEMLEVEHSEVEYPLPLFRAVRPQEGAR
ncbi:hypothetical protein F183_A46020 [Bryobacterales bacterium F-183]|nr:hypothetical protein F183_A46020 [Bryobacterales bacterium F-183]